MEIGRFWLYWGLCRFPTTSFSREKPPSNPCIFSGYMEIGRFWLYWGLCRCPTTSFTREYSPSNQCIFLVTWKFMDFDSIEVYVGVRPLHQNGAYFLVTWNFNHFDCFDVYYTKSCQCVISPSISCIFSHYIFDYKNWLRRR